MFINPDDRRVGNRRQSLTRAQIERKVSDEASRRRGMSRFAQMGQGRLPRGVRRPVRSSSSGTRAFAGGVPQRAGGLAQFLQDRGPSRSRHARNYIEPPMGEVPRIDEPDLPTSPVGAGRLPFDVPLQPEGIDYIRDLMSGEPSALSPEILEQLLNFASNPQPLSPAARDQLTGPTQSVRAPIPGGLIPLGGGNWYDPSTGQLHGSGPMRMF